MGRSPPNPSQPGRLLTTPTDGSDAHGSLRIAGAPQRSQQNRTFSSKSSHTEGRRRPCIGRGGRAGDSRGRPVGVGCLAWKPGHLAHAAVASRGEQSAPGICGWPPFPPDFSSNWGGHCKRAPGGPCGRGEEEEEAEGMLGGTSHKDPAPPRGPDPFSRSLIGFSPIFLHMPPGLHFPLSAFISSSCSLNLFCLVPPNPLPSTSPTFILISFLISAVCARVPPSLELSLPVSCSPPPPLSSPPPPLPGEWGRLCRRQTQGDKCYPGW